MKNISLALLFSATSLFASAQTKGKVAPKPAPKPTVLTLNSTLDSASYGFGMAIGSNLKSTGLKGLNYDVFLKALKESFADGKYLFTQEVAQRVIQQCIADASKEKFATTIAEGKAFFEQNIKKPGMQVTPSGIQYEVLKKGTGIKPTPADTVTVNYKGTLLDGREFDSSERQGGPITFGVTQVVSGWIESLQLMNEGSKFRLYIPYQLAYGEVGNGEMIPPYSNLIFDLELLKVKKTEK